MILVLLFFFTCLNEINATGAEAHKRGNFKNSTDFSKSPVFHIQPRFQGFLSPHPRGCEGQMENCCRIILVPRAYDIETRGGSADENAVGQNVFADG